MEVTTDIKIGQVVKSKSGRDVGKVFIIYDIIDESYVLICDGELRKISNPKRKKIKHLIIYNTVLTEFAQKLQCNENLNDAFVRKLLEPFNQNVQYGMGVE